MNSENNRTFKDNLRRVSGVHVTENGLNMPVIIWKTSSIANPAKQLLFIIDDQKAGHRFANVDDMLYRGEIKYIQVISPSRAAGLVWKVLMA